MIIEKALRLAGPGGHLVARPGREVLHVYTGPLTPSGRFIPRSARTVCRAHTRRLEVIDVCDGASSLDAGRSIRVCARCSARLTGIGRAEQHPRSREEFRIRYAALSKGDVAIALQLATTPAEVDAAAHLSLVLFDVAGTLKPFTERRRTWPSLHDLVNTARARVDGFAPERQAIDDRLTALSLMSREQRATERKDLRVEREAKIARLGMNNAFPEPRDRRGASR